MGFAITADKYTEYGATGNVRLVSPNGDSATGRRLILSSSDNRFYLRGDVKVEVVKKEQRLNFEGHGDEAYLSLDTDGRQLQTSSGSWSFVSQ